LAGNGDVNISVVIVEGTGVFRLSVQYVASIHEYFLSGVERQIDKLPHVSNHRDFRGKAFMLEAPRNPWALNVRWSV